MGRGSALIVLAGALSCTARPDAQPASGANAQPASEADTDRSGTGLGLVGERGHRG
jgi:hypothetical protein